MFFSSRDVTGKSTSKRIMTIILVIYSYYFSLQSLSSVRRSVFSATTTFGDGPSTNQSLPQLSLSTESQKYDTNVTSSDQVSIVLKNKSIDEDRNDTKHNRLPPSPNVIDTVETKEHFESEVGSYGEMDGLVSLDNGAAILDHPMEADFYNSEITVVRPTDDNTAVALVAMGRAGQSSLIAERCIRTIRASGNFTGYILLFTDDMGYEEKRRNLSFDPKVIVIRGRDEDMKPRMADGSKIKYHRMGFMVFKRFKTLVLRYLDYDSRLDDIRYALYLDVDNIVANKLSYFFDDYAATMSEFMSQPNSSDFSYFSLWRDPGMKKMFWQGGQIMYDRYRSTGCVDAWRDQMDTVWGPQDQPLLMNVYNNFTRYGCKVFELPDHHRHFTLLTRAVVEGKTKSLPTLVHITTARAKKFMESDVQGKFIRRAMHLRNDTEMMTEDVSWYQVSQPSDARGKKPNPKLAEATAE